MDAGGWWSPPEDVGLAGTGEWLAQCRRVLDRVEAGWLAALARWDRDQGWAIDGQLSAADWLVARAGMARATAFDKLRVAHELGRRPQVAAAFAEGRLSYSAVRAITRAVGADVEVDEALVTLAEAGTVTDVERAVRVYQRHADQHRPPADPTTRRGLHLLPQHDGTTRVVGVLSDVEAAELAVALDAVGAVDESSAEDRTWAARRADSLVELARHAHCGTGDGSDCRGRRAGGDRYTVHVVVRDGHGALLGGDPLADAELRRLCCDAATVAHVTDGDGVALRLGRRTPTWSTAQRRAITVRDDGQCRWPGCPRSRCDVHHLQPWDRGGRTDIDNGVLLCDRHHTLIHRGYHATGTPDGTLTFHRPDPAGTVIGATRPTAALQAGLARTA